MSDRKDIIVESLACFLGGAVLLYVGVHYGMPYLQQAQGILPIISWFIASGVLLVGLFVVAVVLTRRKTGAFTLPAMLTAFNLNPLNKVDAIWALGALLGVFLLTALVQIAFLKLFSINLLSKEAYDSFFQMKKLTPEQYWIFGVWIPYFFFNIVGEEILWRGYLLPRQIGVFARWAWLFNGLLWVIFHTAMGWRMAILLTPLMFIVPYVVQKSRNTWHGIIIHGLYNGSGFILAALGMIA